MSPTMYKAAGKGVESGTTLDLTKRYTPYPKQQLAHRAPERYVLFGGGMRAGKSVWFVNEAIQLCLEYPGNVGFICRYELTSLQRTTLVTLGQFLDPRLISTWHKTEHYIEFINGSILYYGGVKPTQVEKPYERIKSFTLGFFGIEEATEVTEDIFLLLMSRLDLVLPDGTRPYYRGLLTANPEPGWVRDRFIAENIPDHRFVQALPSDNLALPADYIAGLRRNYPADWVNRYLEGNWDETESGNEIASALWVTRAMEKKSGGNIKHKGPRVMSVDVARSGANQTVIGKRRGNWVYQFQKFPRGNTMEVVADVAATANSFHPSIIVVDSLGVGAGVYDRLDELGYPVEEFKGGNTPYDAYKFFNRRAEGYWAIRLRLEQDKMRLPNDSNLKKQLTSIKYLIRSDKTTQIESKKDLKKRGIKSPDEADALMMLFASAGMLSRIQFV